MAKNSQKSIRKYNMDESSPAAATKTSSRISARKLIKKLLDGSAGNNSNQSKPEDDVPQPSAVTPEKIGLNDPCSAYNKKADTQPSNKPETGPTSTTDTQSAKKPKTGPASSSDIRNAKKSETGSTSEAEKSGKYKKLHQYEIDISAMAELRTINAVEFTSYLATRFKNDGKINNLANNVTVERDEWNIVLKSKVFFKKSVLKYHAKKFLTMKKLRGFVQIVAKERMSYRLAYYKSE